MNKAFTLVELMTVVVIIAVLAGIALPKYGVLIERSHQAEANISLASIRGAQLRYLAENSNFATTTFTNLDIDDPSTEAKFFKYGIPVIAGGVTASATTVATASRVSSASYNYNMFITAGGTIVKGSGAP